MKNAGSFVFILLLFSVSLLKANASDIVYAQEDSLIYEAYVKEFSSSGNIPYNELLTKTAIYFLDKPYVAATLEITDDEKLVINLREFDCTTFVESCLALTSVIRSDDRSFDNFCKKLIAIRYRDGEIEDYASRLHYMTEWIYQNDEKGLLKNMTLNIKGGKVLKRIDFMTTHIESYKHLKDNPENVNKMQDIEDDINNLNVYSIVPKTEIPKIESYIKDGDIIVFATSIKGLDYSHTGMAYRVNGRLHFVHASSRYRKVVIEKKTLHEYCTHSKNCTGISVLRINDI